MKESDSLYILKWEPQFAEVSSAGDMGWTWGYYEVVPADTTAAKSYGKYVNVWKKNKEGEWKVIADIGNKGPQK